LSLAQTHQNLDERTPAEVWRGIDVYKKEPKHEYWFEAWDGLLTGFYLELCPQREIDLRMLSEHNEDVKKSA